MFVQVIEGQVGDADKLRQQMDRWVADLRPGAAGFVGSTAGVTDAGTAITLACFESKAAATANSDRPEQGEWWAATEACYDGEVSFTESDDVADFIGDRGPGAGFVQIMRGESDRALAAKMDAMFEEFAPTFRPDVLGSLRVWTGPESYVEAIYFTSEEEARANEGNEPPPELASQMGDFEELMADVEYLDLRNPWII
jgi:hypothetical protein